MYDKHKTRFNSHCGTCSGGIKQSIESRVTNNTQNGVLSDRQPTSDIPLQQLKQVFRGEVRAGGHFILWEARIRKEGNTWHCSTQCEQNEGQWACFGVSPCCWQRIRWVTWAGVAVAGYKSGPCTCHLPVPPPHPSGGVGPASVWGQGLAPISRWTRCGKSWTRLREGAAAPPLGPHGRLTRWPTTVCMYLLANTLHFLFTTSTSLQKNWNCKYGSSTSPSTPWYTHTLTHAIRDRGNTPRDRTNGSTLSARPHCGCTIRAATAAATVAAGTAGKLGRGAALRSRHRCSRFGTASYTHTSRTGRDTTYSSATTCSGEPRLPTHHTNQANNLTESSW